MNAPLPPHALNPPPDAPAGDRCPAPDGSLRYVWEGRFGSMLIEVREGSVYVDGHRVRPAEALAREGQRR